MPSVPRRREKLSPDPTVRRAILAAASRIVREQGVRAVNVAELLEDCGLSTRAFYRHFRSKDELLTALFLDVARSETRRLRKEMKAASGAVEAVAAWIDGRLDLAYDQGINSDLRHLSEEAQWLMFASPALIQAAFGEIMTPLVEQLERGMRDGVFDDIDPITDAHIIQGAVWACVQRQWAAGDTVSADVRMRALRACLRGLNVAPGILAATLASRQGALDPTALPSTR